MTISKPNMRGLCLVIIAVLFSSCHPYQVLTQMDLPVAPTNLLWSKDGVTAGEMDIDMKSCSDGFEEMYRDVGRMAFEEFDLCMLRKGYRFMPRGVNGGYQNVCLSDMDRAACRLNRPAFPGGSKP